jgi:hypothetical protein
VHRDNHDAELVKEENTVAQERGERFEVAVVYDHAEVQET